MTRARQSVCTKDDTHIDTKTLPVLTDTSVWTKVDDNHVDPTEENDGFFIAMQGGTDGYLFNISGDLDKSDLTNLVLPIKIVDF